MKDFSKSEAIELQKKLSTKVITTDFLPKNIKCVCGVDASYKGNKACCAAVIVDKDLNEIEKASTTHSVTKPYTPGLLMLREAPLILKTVQTLKKKFDILMIDGNGQLHPRRCGLACYVGLTVDKPTIGIAKRLLCGKVRKNSKVELADKVLGYKISRKNKTIYVSTGHKVSLMTAVMLTQKFTRTGNLYPEPLRLADFYSKNRPKK